VPSLEGECLNVMAHCSDDLGGAFVD
jgi:hypothetical protein